MRMRNIVRRAIDRVTSPRFVAAVRLGIAAVALVKAFRQWRKSNRVV